MSAQENFMPKQELTTTLNAIRACAPCVSGWETLLSGLNKTVLVDEPLVLARILEINGVRDAVWALQTVEGADNAIRLFACACARYSLDIFERVYPDDKRPRQAIETAERFAKNQAAPNELGAARTAAAAAVADVAAWHAACAANAGNAWHAARTAADAAALAATEAAVEDVAWDYFGKEFLRLCALDGEYGEVD